MVDVFLRHSVHNYKQFELRSYNKYDDVMYRHRRLQTSSQPVHGTVAPNQPAFTVISPVFDYQSGYDELNLIKNETYDNQPDAIAAQASVANPYEFFDKASATKA